MSVERKTQTHDKTLNKSVFRSIFRHLTFCGGSKTQTGKLFPEAVYFQQRARSHSQQWQRWKQASTKSAFPLNVYFKYWLSIRTPEFKVSEFQKADYQEDKNLCSGSVWDDFCRSRQPSSPSPLSLCPSGLWPLPLKGSTAVWDTGWKLNCTVHGWSLSKWRKSSLCLSTLTSTCRCCW